MTAAIATPFGAGAPENPIKVMLVDDSLVARSVARRALSADADVEIVASASNGKTAIDTVAAAAPDIVILDIEMPVMNGLEALPELLKRRPGLKVVISSSLSRQNAEVSIKALKLGAADILLKPKASDGPQAAEEFCAELVAKVRSIGGAKKHATRPRADRPAPRPTVRTVARTGAHPVSAIAIGSSTGGPQALAATFGGWKANGGNQPVFITQHMPPTFTSILAEHLSRSSSAVVAEGQDGEPVAESRIYVAPGDKHMRVVKRDDGLFITLDGGPKVNFCRPAVDPMFESLAACYGAGVLACVLTGMGRDGAAGAAAVRAKGGLVLAQDEETSVVWGMPGAVVAGGHADEVLALPAIGARLAELARGKGVGR